MPLRAVIYVVGPDAEKWLLLCTAHVQHHHYELVAVVRGAWDGVRVLLDDGRADLVVAARRDHPPANRLPREEFVEEEGPAPTPRQRRPRLIRRDGAGEP